MARIHEQLSQPSHLHDLQHRIQAGLQKDPQTAMSLVVGQYRRRNRRVAVTNIFEVSFELRKERVIMKYKTPEESLIHGQAGNQSMD